MTSRLIHAHFAGKCRTCGKAVRKGDPIYFAKHYGVRCMGCGPHTAADAPIPPKRKGRKSSQPTPTPATPAPLAESSNTKAATRCSDGKHRIEYASVKEAVEDAFDDYAQNDHNREAIRGNLAHHLAGDDKWANYFTKGRLLSELTSPDRSLLDAVDRMREKLMGEVELPTTPRRKVRRFQEWGDELDADQWLARDPMGWEQSCREYRPRNTVTIGVNLAVSAGVTPAQLLYRGAAALALADHLSQQGYNVGIVAFQSVREVARDVDHGIAKLEVKSPDMPMDLSAVAFCLCEIAFFRVVMVHGNARHWTGKLSSGFGYPSELPAADREGLDYVIDADVLSEEAAAEWLTAQVKKEVAHV